MDTAPKSIEPAAPHRKISAFRRKVLAPASIAIVLIALILILRDAREAYLQLREHPEAQGPQFLLAARAFVDLQLQAIRAVDAKSLGHAFGKDLDTHDCDWKFDCKESSLGLADRMLDHASDRSSQLLNPHPESRTGPGLVRNVPPLNATGPLFAKADATPLIRGGLVLAPDAPSSQLSTSHGESVKTLNQPASRSNVLPFGSHEGDLARPLKEGPPAVDLSTVDLSADHAKAAASGYAPPAQANSLPPQLVKNEASDARDPRQAYKTFARAVETDPSLQHAGDFLESAPGAPPRVSRVGFLIVPTLHTLYGIPHGIKAINTVMQSAGGWASGIFILCDLVYVLLIFSLRAPETIPPIIRYLLLVTSPVVVAIMAQAIQWLVGGVFYGVSWVLGALILGCAEVTPILALIVSARHIYKTPHELVEAAEVIREV